MRTAILAVHFAALFLFSASPAMAESVSPDTSGRIDVRDVDAAALLFAVAEAVNFNLIAPIPAGRPRVTFKTEFASIEELLQKLAKQVGMRGTVLGRRILVLSPCLHSPTSSSGLNDRGQLSISLTDVALGEVLELVRDGQAPPGTPIDAALLSRRLVLRVINASREDIARGLMTAFGSAPTLSIDDQRAGIAECSGVESASLSASQLKSQALRSRTNNCPYRTEDISRSCDPLEFFSLKDVFPRGYVEGLGRRFAFIEAPDGVLHILKNGSYVGRNYGRVRDISRSRIELRELVVDSKNMWVESIVNIQHWAAPASSYPP